MDAADSLFYLPDWAALSRVGLKLLFAALLGGLVGAEREYEGKAAGLRTHTVVALGSALFVIAPLESGVMNISQVIHGIATGVGFIGAGTVLKRTRDFEIQGLTTAAGIWLTAAIGVAAGVGHLWIAVMGAIFALVVLRFLRRLEVRGRD